MENTIKNLVDLTCLNIKPTAPSYLVNDKSRTIIDSMGKVSITRSNKITTTDLLDYISNRL